MKKKKQPETGPWQAPARRLVGSVDDAVRRSVGRSAGYARLREAVRLNEHVTLLRRLGPQSADVAASARRLEQAQRRSAAALAALRLAEAGDVLSAADASVLGQVTTGGRPLAGVTVTLTDERGPEKGYLARASVDGAGWFVLSATRAAWEEFFADSKQRSFFVTTPSGELMHVEILPAEAEGATRVVHLGVPEEAFRSAAEDLVSRPAPAAAAKIYLGQGARGELVRRLQTALDEAGFDPGPIDGDYGPRTAAAVESFRADRGLDAGGEVDGATWRALFDADPPSTEERALAVTADFEGHGFTLAQGNWDDAGITWGIVGFTLRHGGLGKVVKRVYAEHPQMLAEDFGPQRSQTLLEALDKPVSERVAWADSVSHKHDKATLDKPWREAFARFGARPEVQAAQLAVMEEEYAQPAQRTAAELGLESELGFALAFDAQVQNGGVKAKARKQIEAARREHEPADERELRRLVAQAVADQARPQYRQDVLARKLTLADGEGTVHGRRYVLRNWGLGETPV